MEFLKAWAWSQRKIESSGAMLLDPILLKNVEKAVEEMKELKLENLKLKRLLNAEIQD